MKREIASIAISICLVISACDKTEEDEAAVINDTIAGLILKSPDFSSLEALLVKANLATILDGPGPFTLFAPDDSAFAAAGITASLINSLSQQQAQSILLYHLFNSNVMLADLPAGPNAKMTTFAGDSVFISKTTSDTYINGAKISQSDIIADNGTLHTIENVLNPPIGSIVQTIYRYSLDSLGKAIARATNDTTGNPGLKQVLDSSIITMFAPTDSAFISLLTDLSLPDINDIPVDTLVGIISYHISSGRIFSPDLVEAPLTMLKGGNTSIRLNSGINNGPTITGNGNNGNASNIITQNIVSRNAVVHFIDRVLIP